MIIKVFCINMAQMKLMSNSYELAPRWMSQNTFDDKLELVQVMAWCRQARNHYLIKPQWVNVVCHTRSTYYWAYLLLNTAWGTCGIDLQADFKEGANCIQLNSSVPCLPIRLLIFFSSLFERFNLKSVTTMLAIEQMVPVSWEDHVDWHC